jgi:hypothetical protein
VGCRTFLEGDAMSKRHIGILAVLFAGVLLTVCAGAPGPQPTPQIAPNSPEH